MKDTVEPPAVDKNGGGELAFTLDNTAMTDELLADFQRKGITIAQSPTAATFGYTFLALDPDGHRLRFVSLRK